MRRILAIIVMCILLAVHFAAENPWTGVFLAALVIVLIVGFLCDLLMRRSIVVRTDTPVYEGASRGARCRIRFSNEGLLPVFDISAYCTVTNLYTGENVRQVLHASLLPKGTCEVPVYFRNDHCGKINVRIDRIKLNGILGILPVPIPERANYNYTVVPDINEILIAYDLRESPNMDNDVYSPYRKGDDPTEIFQVRDYVPGDDIRRIHWKLSGKQDRLIVKDPSLPMDKDLIVVMDKSLAAPISEEALEGLAELTVSICQSLADAGLMYRVIWNDVTNRTVFEREIQFADEIATLIPDLLSSRPMVADENAGDLYSQIYGPTKATHVVYVSCHEALDLEDVFAGAHVIFVNAAIPAYRDAYQEIVLI